MKWAFGTAFALHALGATALVAPRATATAPGPWVTIDSSGNVATVTPTVSHSSTISAPPSYLTQTSEYILSIGGHTKTTTATPPYVTATGPGTAGAFMVCNNANGALAPFCLPQAGSEMVPNKTYYITWDPSRFPSGQTVQLETEYTNGEGFATAPLAGSSGFYAWTIDASFIAEQGAAKAVNVTFYLAYNATSAGGSQALVRAAGPSVIVTQSPATIAAPKHHHHIKAVAVAVPVVVGVAVLALMGFCVWSYRHHGHLPCIGGIVSKRTSSFSAKGYGVRQSYGQRTGSAFPPPPFDGRNYNSNINNHIDNGSWSPPPNPGGGNAFREELKRQEEERR